MQRNDSPTDPLDRQVNLNLDTDNLETTTGKEKNPPPESPSSNADAGLDEIPILDESDEINENPHEITMTDLEAETIEQSNNIHVPEMSDLNTPGDVDIEDLDEDDLSDTDLPADARLDPLEP